MDRMNPDNVTFLIPLFLWLSVPVRLFMRKNNCAFPQNLILFIIGIGLGTLIACFWKDFEGISKTVPRQIIAIYIPISVMSSIYHMDYYIFIRSLPQVMIISFVGVIFNVLALGVILKSILHPDWDQTMGILAALACVPMQPINVIFMLKELAKFNYLGTMLEAEAVLSLIPINIMYKVSMEYAKGTITTWYHSIAIIIRFLLGGVIFGCITGKLTTLSMNWLYNEPLSSLSISIGMSFLTYYTAEHLLYISGTFSMVCLACFVVSEKHRFSPEIEAYMSNLWGTMAYLTEITILMLCTIELIACVWRDFEVAQTYSAVITYFATNIIRLFFFLITSFILNKMTYEMNIKSLMILAYSGVKGSYNLLIVLDLLYQDPTKGKIRTFVVEVLGLMFLSMITNGSTMRFCLKLIGLSELSDIRKNNMNNCVKFMMDKRINVINTLKLNRYLSDANWSTVRSETLVKNPYNTKMKYDVEDDDDDDGGDYFMWNKSSALCPECLNEVPFELSEKETAEMLKEMQVKILKAKKVSIINQYENGTINKNCYQILVHTFESMIESNPKNTTVEIWPYLKQRRCLMCVKKFLIKVRQSKAMDPPRNPCRRLCFYTMMHVAYEYVFFGLVVLNACTFPWLISLKYIGALNYINFTFCLLFMMDVAIKIGGYAKDLQGRAQMLYFHFAWNCFDFFFTLFGFMNAVLIIIMDQSKGLHEILTKVTYALKILDILRLLKVFYLMQPLYSKLLASVQYRIDSRMCLGYDLGTALVNCCEEMLDLIPQLVEVKLIREIYMKELHEERQMLIKQMEKVQEARPWIPITVKTKQGIRMTLNSMEQALKELKVSGFVDNIEFAFIFKQIYAKQKVLRSMKFVEPSPPQVIFHEVPWMADDEVIIKYLYNNVEMVSWNAGEIVCTDGRFAQGVYIVVTGLLRLRYDPKRTTLERLSNFGSIPVVDYLSTLKFDTAINDNIMLGNSFGELSVLTGRPYDCTIIADSHCQAYLLTTPVLKEAMKLSRDPIRGLESMMWKFATINLAVTILMDVPMYQSFTPEQIKFKLERAFTPNLRCYKMFVITEMMDDVVLLEGVVADYTSGEIFTAPSLIPRTILKLILPMSSYLAFENYVETRLLIIPMGEAKDFEIMEFEEEIAELVSMPSSKCLLHTSSIKPNAKTASKRKSDKGAMLTQESTYSFKPVSTENRVIEILDHNLSTASVAKSLRNRKGTDEMAKEKYKDDNNPA